MKETKKNLLRLSSGGLFYFAAALLYSVLRQWNQNFYFNWTIYGGGRWLLPESVTLILICVFLVAGVCLRRKAGCSFRWRSFLSGLVLLIGLCWFVKVTGKDEYLFEMNVIFYFFGYIPLIVLLKLFNLAGYEFVLFWSYLFVMLSIHGILTVLYFGCEGKKRWTLTALRTASAILPIFLVLGSPELIAISACLITFLPLFWLIELPLFWMEEPDWWKKLFGKKKNKPGIPLK